MTTGTKPDDTKAPTKRRRKTPTDVDRLKAIERIRGSLRRLYRERDDAKAYVKEINAKIDVAEGALADAIDNKTLPLFDTETGEVAMKDDDQASDAKSDTKSNAKSNTKSNTKSKSNDKAPPATKPAAK